MYFNKFKIDGLLKYLHIYIAVTQCHSSDFSNEKTVEKDVHINSTIKTSHAYP